MSNNGPRYQASTKTEHGCCWSASVIDTLDCDTRRKGQIIVETDSIERAIEIAAALNRSAMT